jgi:multiple sugar transport system permease protein
VKTKKILLRLLFYAGIIFFTFIAVLPIIWMILSSLRPASEFFKIPPTILPRQWSVSNFVYLFTRTDFPVFLWNSFIVTVFTVLICVSVASLAAYSLARFKFRGRKLFIQFSMMAYMLPTVLLIIPLYLLFAKVHLTDNLFGLSLSYTALTLPYSIWLLRIFFKSIPIDLEEAAAIDGASRLKTMLRIVLPLSMPGIIATTVYTFTYVWNEYMFALVLINSDAKRTFPIGLQTFITTFDIQWEYILTGGVVVSIPAVIVFLLTQRQLIQGLSAGAVKG